MLKNTPACHFRHIFGTKQWITLERKKISKIANKVLEKRQRRQSVPNFKTRALAVWKLKGKENCENEHREMASFMYNLVQKTNATVQLWWHFIPTSPLNFFTPGFHQKVRFKRNFKKRPKVIFVKSLISSPSRKRKLGNWTLRNGQFYVQLCTENQCNQATLMAFYTNFATSLEPRPSSPPDLRPSGRGPGKTSILFGEIRASASIFCVLEKVSLFDHGALGLATRRRS